MENKINQNKCCIIFRWELRHNSGGPAGYLMNLKKGLELINSNFCIFSDFTKTSPKEESKRRKINSFLLEDIKISLYYLKPKTWMKAKSEIFESFDSYHFQSLEDIYDCKRFKKGKKFFLTPHRPEPLWIEKINEIQNVNNTNYSFPLLKLVLMHIEKVAYKVCDGFIFPSKEAKDIYMDFPGFSKYIADKKVKYLITGTNVIEGKPEYRLENNNFIISFIGRHTFIKGYDFLKEFFIENLDFINDNNIQIICAGKIIGDYPKNQRWKELGLINNPHDLIKSSDFVILPNLNTYFDLVALEVLAQGKILLASDTGGNISLSKQTKGVKLFMSNNQSSLKERIIELLNIHVDERTELENCNLSYFEENCKLDRFANNYLITINELQKEVSSVQTRRKK